MHERNPEDTFQDISLPDVYGLLHIFCLVSFRPLGLARNEFKVADLEAYLLEKLAGADSGILEAPHDAEWWADADNAICVGAVGAVLGAVCV